ncbi:hypothetical protein ACPFTR_003256 [Vibrio cholerae]
MSQIIGQIVDFWRVFDYDFYQEVRETKPNSTPERAEPERMIIVKPITEKILTDISAKLGDNWRYHQILTAENKTNNTGYLFNAAGLFIWVRYCYGEKLPRWSLQFRHPEHKTLQNVITIGCSIEKSPQAIAQDLKNRLLSNTAFAYQRLAEMTHSAEMKAIKKMNDAHIIEALKKVMNLNPTYDHRYSAAWRVENAKGSEIARLSKVGAGSEHDFSVTIHSVSADELIKIMQIIKQ